MSHSVCTKHQCNYYCTHTLVPFFSIALSLPFPSPSLPSPDIPVTTHHVLKSFPEDDAT